VVVELKSPKIGKTTTAKDKLGFRQIFVFLIQILPLPVGITSSKYINTITYISIINAST
jgi:hypothetical protein